MLTYELKKAPGIPLYESLYRCIRRDILSGVLKPGEKLPSKRALSENLDVSKITVEGAYNQLLSEGFIRSQEKVGYFVENIERVAPSQEITDPEPIQQHNLIDLTANGPVQFPFSVWSRLQREVMLDLGEKLLLPLHNQGLPELRKAIAHHLAEFRGMQVNPSDILIGAGTDFLYNLLVQLLGREKVFAVEEPGYRKIRKVYQSAGAKCVSALLDNQGVRPENLRNVQVLHISPSHHFPTGLVTSMPRRLELLNWLKEKPDRWIIEDDYDSEFRFAAHPMPTMQSLDTTGQVIYMNTFSKTLAPSIRISYLVLPHGLMEKFRSSLGFYSCTVPSFEQYTLARFLTRGHFEKHINRMRKFYRSRRNRVLSALQSCPFADKLTFREKDAGLHFLVQVNTELSDEKITQFCLRQGVQVKTLSQYFWSQVPAAAKKCVVVNYSGLSDENLQKLEEILQSPSFAE